MRQEGVIEGALLVKHQDNNRYKKKKNFKKEGGSKKSYPPCCHCEKKGHPPYKCWRRPDAK